MRPMKYYCLNNTDIIVLSLFACLFCGCKQREEAKPQAQVEQAVPAPQHEMQPVYSPPVASSPVTPLPATTVNETKPPQESSTPPVVEKPAPHKVTISRYYEEGYEAGYDDGEDDAVMDNGWGGQYDDACRYKGKKRKEYQLGYEEGYEAGYYDNKDSDE